MSQYLYVRLSIADSVKVKKTDLPVMAPESEILPAALEDATDIDDLQDEEEDDADVDDDEVCWSASEHLLGGKLN